MYSSRSIRRTASFHIYPHSQIQQSGQRNPQQGRAAIHHMDHHSRRNMSSGGTPFCKHFGDLTRHMPFLPRLGPTKSQIIRPKTGRMRTRTIQKTFPPVDAELSIVLTIAQISAIKMIIPKRPPASIPMLSSFQCLFVFLFCPCSGDPLDRLYFCVSLMMPGRDFSGRTRIMISQNRFQAHRRKKRVMSPR